jgi:hypothetical protein
VPNGFLRPLSRIQPTWIMPQLFTCSRVRNLLLAWTVWLVGTAFHAANSPGPHQLWLYCPTNLLVDGNVDKLEVLWRRAAKVGYSHVLLGDTKFCVLENMPERYFHNVERVKKLAAELKIEIVPGVFPIGWSNALLAHDPNLAEGLPVRDALFVIHGGEARLQADPPVALPDSFSDLKRWGWHDDFVTSDGNAAKIADPAGRVGRVVKTVKVSPFRQYHISVRIKTQDFHGVPEVKVLAGDHALEYNDLGVKPTQDWTTHHTVFNSLEHRELNIYFGCWDGGKGSLWYAEPKLEEVGLLNVLRRPGAPLTVRRYGDPEAKVLEEGRDFERVVDPRLGNSPWAGEYDVWHEPPTVHTKLPDGTRLRVSYYHPMIIYGGSVMIALSEPRTMELLRDHARRVHTGFGAKSYFMEHDEIRLFNWDAASERRHLDAGQVLAANVKACTQILRDLNPSGLIYVWSDMFDPHHNAMKDYYLVHGSLASSWEGLDPSINIANWNFDHRDESLKFFAKRGHRQLIAGYYDSPPENITKWLDSAAKSGSVDAVMYTTWQGNYTDIERFAEIVKRHPWWTK